MNIEDAYPEWLPDNVKKGLDALKIVKDSTNAVVAKMSVTFPLEEDDLIITFQLKDGEE